MTWSSWGPTTRPASSGCSTEPRCPPGRACSTSAAARARCCGGSASRAPIDGTGVDLHPGTSADPRSTAGGRRRAVVSGRAGVVRPGLLGGSGQRHRPAGRAGPARAAWCCWATATGGKRPATSTSHALGATIDDLLDWQATLAIGAPHGLTLVRALPSSVEQWDRYEATWAANGERYAARAPRRAGPGGVPGLDPKRPAALHGAGRPRHARVRAAACSGRARQSVTGA